ncbi:MAG: hypothetical protein AMXMBFR83_23920 [Phycisphaerae bacterium]
MIECFTGSADGGSPWIPVFPGAEGNGVQTPGGRGGTVYEVTNLNDSGPGSLRSAIEAAGPRIVVFRTGGTIVLQSTLLLVNPYITIAGQTAPGGGIALRNTSNFNIYEDPSATLDVRTHDVVIRHLRIRSGIGGRESDALQLHHGACNVVIDHCSFSWSVDEVISTWSDPRDVTFSWCIFSEGLRDAGHSEGSHSAGPLFGSDGCTRVSLHHNLFAHNNDRNPRIKIGGLMDVVNNAIYNFGDNAGVISRDVGPMGVNYVGNYVRKGADSSNNYEVQVWNGPFPLSLYVEGNLGPHRTDPASAQNLVVDPSGWGVLAPARQPLMPVRTDTAAQALNRVLQSAGANRPQRDAVDQRIVADVLNGTGRIIDNPLQVGGWPTLEAGTPPADRDHDGMPDDWEIAFQLDPDSPGDGPDDADDDGYTNVEEFLNDTHPRVDPTCGVRLVAYHGSAPEGAVLSAAGPGRFIRTDRAHTLAAVPPAYACALLVRYAEADADFSGNELIGIQLAADATIAVGCAAGSTPPGWLAEWTATGETLTARLDGIAGGAVSFNLFTKAFAGGQTVMLGGNAPGGGNATIGYMALIRPNCPRPTPVITGQPQHRYVRRDGQAVFTVSAAGGEGPLTFQWFKDGIPLDDAGHYSGTATPNVRVGPVSAADAGRYSVVVTGEWCAVTSADAVLALATPCDFDGDLDVDLEDFGHFQGCLGSSSPECFNARLDADLDVDRFDTSVFVGCFSGPNIPAAPQCRE